VGGRLAARRSSYRVPRLDSGPAWADHRATARTSDRSPPLTRRDNVKDGLRFVDCDMHIMEPPDLFDRYLDPRCKHPAPPPPAPPLRRPRSPPNPGPPPTTQPLSGSRLADTGRLNFAIERNYSAE